MAKSGLSTLPATLPITCAGINIAAAVLTIFVLGGLLWTGTHVLGSLRTSQSSDASQKRTPLNTTPGSPATGVGKESASSSGNDSKQAAGKKQATPAPGSPPTQGATNPYGTYSSGYLVASPASVSLTSTISWAEFSVRSSTNEAIFQPIVSAPNGLLASVEEFYPTMGGGPATKSSWRITVRRIDFNSGGKEYVTVNDPVGRFAAARVLISWNPAPSFYLTKGGLTRSDGATTITHTATFTMVPNTPYFGNPTMTIRLYNGPCSNTAELTRTFVHNGTNTFTMSCVVQRLVAMPGSVLPLPSEASFNIDVSGTVDGQFINGSYPIAYVLPSGYDR